MELETNLTRMTVTHAGCGILALQSFEGPIRVFIFMEVNYMTNDTDEGSLGFGAMKACQAEIGLTCAQCRYYEHCVGSKQAADFLAEA